MSKHRRKPTVLSRALTLASVASLGAAAFLGATAFSPSQRAQAATSNGGFSQTETLTRTHLVDGKDDAVDTRKVTVTADVTTNLKDRQGVHITWSGAHPTGGVVYDATSQYAVDQEYPVVVLQCRGVDSPTASPQNMLMPQTCYTQTPNQRYEPAIRGAFPPYRLDRYATAADRALSVGAPKPLPADCALDPSMADHWVPMNAADGTTYYGGFNGCAGLSPDQSTVANALSPASTTFGATLADGTGSADFIVQSAQSNATLGCSSTVACALVVIPIMGISCDSDAASLPAADQPPAAEKADDAATCQAAGQFSPTAPGDQSHDFPSDMAVSGSLWWSASNWRNRITIPITMAQSSAVCDVVSNSTPEDFYGSPYMTQLVQQWAPRFCLDPKLFRIQQVSTSEVASKSLLDGGLTNGRYLGIKSVFQSMPPDSAFTNPVVQAPTAISGWGIAFVIDDVKSHQLTSLNLDARLLAKLLTMSYPASINVAQAWAREDKYQVQSHNPLDIIQDPEFRALNPNLNIPTNVINQIWASSTLFAMSSDSDVMTALTSYINADADARAWLDGRPDPWGMVVNPYYAKIALPVSLWPQLDPTYIDVNNNCIGDGHLPIMPLIAGPVSDPELVAFNMQYAISNSQVNCTLPTGVDDANSRRLAGEGRQATGFRFLLGVVGLADAARYQLNLASLETYKSADALDTFTDATGRTFAAPSTGGLRAAAKLLQPDPGLNTWTLPYEQLRSNDKYANAYPGTMLMSTDVPTIGLTAADAGNYANFLTYAAGPGQQLGTGNGQLPDGYLPINANNGLSQLADFTIKAAAEVRSQRGRVPLVNGGYSSLPATGSASSGAGSAGGTGAGSADNPPASNASTDTVKAPSTTPSSSTPSAPAPAVALAGQTQSLSPGWAAFAVPALAVLGLAAAAGAAWSSGVGRR